jgi:protein TonB
VAESKISAATPAPWPKPDFQTPQPSIQSAISRSASSSSAFEVEADASAKPEPGEAALLESLPELSDKRPGISSPASKQYPWQPVSKPSSEPMASALRRAAEVAGKTQGNVPAASASISSSLRGAAAAAPAKETSQPKLDLAHLGSSAAAEAPELETAPPVPVAEGLPAPKFESEGKPVLTLLEPDSASGGGKKLLVVAAIVLVAAASGYVGWTRMHPAPESSTVQKQSSPAAVPSPVEAPAVPSSASAASAEPSAVSSAEPQSLSDSSAAVPAPSVVVKPSKTSGKGGESLPSAREENASAENAPPASASSPVSIAKVSVNKALTVTKAQAADTAEALPPPPPPAVEVASGSGDSSLAGIVAASSHIPVPSAPGTVKVSQGVIQGLLIRKVSPVYPQQALQMHIQGSVQLQASISKEGKISNVKTLSGDPSLARAAADAVRQWKYKPYLLNGEAVGIQTEVTVNFKLPN